MDIYLRYSDWIFLNASKLIRKEVIENTLNIELITGLSKFFILRRRKK